MLAFPGNTPKPQPKTGMPSPMGFQSSFQANGQAANKGNILQGLAHDSQIKPNTGTATGDRAAQDFAKGQLYSNRAKVGRGVETKNAEFQGQMMKQKEQLTQQGRASRLQRYQQATNQSVDQMQLANQLSRQQLDMRTRWVTSILGLMQ
jgi:hypothetical protein